MTGTFGGRWKAARPGGSPLEVGLLALGLAVLAFGAGAVGWAVGHRGTSVRTVTVAASRSPAQRTQPPAPAARGNPAAGKTVFVASGCGSCHVLAAAGASGTVGPNLDQVKLNESELLAWITTGKGAMPSFKSQLSKKQLADLVAFLAK